MRYFIIAGDPSGDMYAAHFIQKLMVLDKEAQIGFVGGKKMSEVLNQLPLIPLERTAFMGFVDVLKNSKTIFQNFKIVKNHLLKNHYEVVLLVDYPGFNLKMAKWCKLHNIKVFYYISPTVWAWKEGRVNTIIRYVDKLFTIIPFETEFYKKYNYDVEFVGHPLLDVLNENVSTMSRKDFLEKHHLPDKKIIAVLPGSRWQELKYLLPKMISVRTYFKDYQFVIAGISRFSKDIYKKYLSENVSVVNDDTYSVLQHSVAGIIKSGTSTMEAALLGLPQVVCYKGGQISYWIARMLVKNIRYISMVNLIMQKEVVKELIQHEFNEENLKNELKKILHNESTIIRMKEDYLQLKEKLGGAGASERLAEKVFYALKNQ